MFPHFIKEVLFPAAGLFGVDAESGRVFTRRSLRGARAAVYRLTVQVRDQGFPPRAATAALTVLVENPNTYSGGPRFLYPAQDGETVKIPEVREREQSAICSRPHTNAAKFAQQ